MKLRWSRIGIAVGGLLIAMQLVQIRRDNPPTDLSKTIYATVPVPANVRSVLDRSCADCHSNETRWPWYSYVAPVSWFVGSDVHGARRQLNLSEWATYPAKKKEHKLETICDEIMNNDMPDSKYVFIHRNARLSQQERTAVCQWTQSAP